MKRCILFAELTALAFALTSGPGRSVAADLYVATNGAGPDGLTWATATNSIQDAINAIDGTYRTNTVWVSNGVYEVGGVTNYPTGAILTNRVAIYKSITVRSANNDPTNTIIKGAWDPITTNGPASVRCVYMTNGSSLIGFMLTNGATLTTNESSSVGNICGGGVWCQSTNTVISNCVIAGNAANFDGGGAYYGTLYNCTLTGNKYIRPNYNGGVGGGSAYGTLYNCTLTGNYSSYSGGGTYGCTLSNCTLSGNSAVGVGGGGRADIMFNCTIVNNWSAASGGGTYGGTLYNCTLSSNSSLITSSSSGGGGAYGATLYSCLIISNSASRDGGGAYGGNLYNCTIVSNSAANAGSGVRASTLYNCTSWSNRTDDYQPTAYYSCGVGYTNGGSVSGNITNNPLFIDSGTGNWRLSANSPSVNTGSNASWMVDSADVRSEDLDGRSRIDKFSGKVDMGCYEYLPSGTIFSAR